MPEIRADEAGRRCSDVVRQAIADGHAGRWAAIRLSDGGSDGVAYDTRGDAVRHQLHESQCAYVKIPRDDMGPGEATRFLEIHREVYDKGMRFIDPEDPDRELISPMTLEGFGAALAALKTGGGTRR